MVSFPMVVHVVSTWLSGSFPAETTV